MESAVKAILKLQRTSGTIAKRKILERHKKNVYFQKLLYYSLNPQLTYKLSERTLRKPTPYSAPTATTIENIFEICDMLAERKGIDDATFYQVKGFLAAQKQDEKELYIQILSKTLRLGVTAKTVNKVVPNLIPEWEVQQAYPIEKYPFEAGTWFCATQKLNGVRATYYRGNLYGRSGEVFANMSHITDELDQVGEDIFVFDGELTLLDKTGMSDNEAFRTATGIINSDAVDKSRIAFTIFDVIPVKEFESGCSKSGYMERREVLNNLTNAAFRVFRYSSILPALYMGTDQKRIKYLLDKMVREDKEGLMINLDVPYQRKRHSGILKVKRFYTMDLPIIRCEEGSGRLLGTLGSIVVSFEGNEVSVGSGFTNEERALLWDVKERLPGLLCEVKYKEVTMDKETKKRSLQFPVFVCLRTDKAEENIE